MSFVRDVIVYVAGQGIAADEMYRELDIKPELLTRPDEMVPGDLSHRAWLLAEELTEDADIGLHIGESVHPSTLGLVGFVMLSCERLGEALEKLIRYTNLLTDGVVGTVNRSGRLAAIEIVVTTDVENSLSSHPRQRMESSFAAIATISRILTNKPFAIREMRFVHQRPESVAEHARIFAAPVLFQQNENKMIFAAEALDLPVLLANRDLLAAFEAKADEHLLTMQKQTRAMQVRRIIFSKMRGDVPGITDVARTLGVSGRSLQRELAMEQTTYSGLVDAVRRDLAIRYLRDERTTVAEISFLLGFSEPSAFHRSFKRWTGTTPRAFRADPV